MSFRLAEHQLVRTDEHGFMIGDLVEWHGYADDQNRHAPWRGHITHSYGSGSYRVRVLPDQHGHHDIGTLTVVADGLRRIG